MAVRDEGIVPPALRPAGVRVCIVMACTDMSEADKVGETLLELNMGCLVTYRRAEDLMYNAPAGKVALVILATRDNPTMVRRTLRWLRHRWPRSPVMVVGDEGCGDHEMAARTGGANYLARPITPQQWSALLCHALGGTRQRRAEGAAQRPSYREAGNAIGK